MSGTKPRYNPTIWESCIEYCGGTETRIQLGRRTGGASPNWAKGTMQSIRIYNRALTDSERERNAMVDALRFGLIETKPCNGETASMLFGRRGLAVILR